MEKTKVIASFSLSIGMLSIAGALAYFTLTVARIFDDLPATLTEVKEIADIVEPVFKDVTEITDMIPGILLESEAIRALVPDVLDELEQTRTQYSQTMDRVSADTQLVLKEVELVRNLLPDVVNEISAIREALPPILDRVEVIVNDASNLGHEAGEAAAKGMFTGLIKAPFSAVSSGFKRFSGQLNTRELELLESAVGEVLETEELGFSTQWHSLTSNGSVTLTSLQMLNNLKCADLQIHIEKGNIVIENRLVSFCQEDGTWKVQNGP